MSTKAETVQETYSKIEYRLRKRSLSNDNEVLIRDMYNDLFFVDIQPQ